MHYHIRESGAATSEQQLTLEAQSFSKQRKQAKHVPAAASDSHIARNFFFSCLPFGRGGTLLASLHEAGASFLHAQHSPKHPNLPAFSELCL